jgi:hypothetical protein
MVAGERQTRSVEPDAAEVTRAFFAERAGKLLTPDEAREANRNLARFFDLLAEWEQAEGDTAP